MKNRRRSCVVLFGTSGAGMSKARQRFRYCLRTLLMLTFTVACLASNYGWWRRTSLAQRPTNHIIASKGGLVWFDRADRTIDVEFGVPLHEGCGQIVALGRSPGAIVTFTD